jgi:hypothetical protein
MAKGKSSNRRLHEGGANLPVLVDPLLVKALSHVVRQHILLAAIQNEVSPTGLSKMLGEGLSQVAYHVKVLRDDCDGMLEETRTEPRRGAIEHYYRATAKALIPAKAWRRVRNGMRAVVGAGQASDLFNDLAAALQAGKLQSAEDDHITRIPLVLDKEGQRNVKAIANCATKEVEDEQRAAAKRMNNGNGKASCHIFALLAFEAAWEPTNMPVLAAQVAGGGTASTNGVNGVGHRDSREQAKGSDRRQVKNRKR